MRNPIHTIREFYREVVVEFKKCTWPQRGELTESTIVVILATVILSVTVAVVDAASQWLIRMLTAAN